METWMHSVLRLAFRQGQDDPKQPKSFQVAGVRNGTGRAQNRLPKQAFQQAWPLSAQEFFRRDAEQSRKERKERAFICLPPPVSISLAQGLLYTELNPRNSQGVSSGRPVTTQETGFLHSVSRE